MNDSQKLERRAETIWYLYLKGWSLSECAEIFKISRSMVYKILLKKKEENKSTIQIEPVE